MAAVENISPMYICPNCLKEDDFESLFIKTLQADAKNGASEFSLTLPFVGMKVGALGASMFAREMHGKPGPWRPRFTRGLGWYLRLVGGAWTIFMTLQWFHFFKMGVEWAFQKGPIPDGLAGAAASTLLLGLGIWAYSRIITDSEKERESYWDTLDGMKKDFRCNRCGWQVTKLEGSSLAQEATST